MIKSSNEEIKAIVSFIEETADGKYTVLKPRIVELQFERLPTPEHDRYSYIEDLEDGVLLGTSF